MNEGTIGAAMNSVASMVIREIAQVEHVDVSVAAASFLSSRTAAMLFDESTKLWCDGPSTIVDDYLEERAQGSGTLDAPSCT